MYFFFFYFTGFRSCRLKRATLRPPRRKHSGRTIFMVFRQLSYSTPERFKLHLKKKIKSRLVTQEHARVPRISAYCAYYAPANSREQRAIADRAPRRTSTRIIHCFVAGARKKRTSRVRGPVNRTASHRRVFPARTQSNTPPTYRHVCPRPGGHARVTTCAELRSRS